MLHGMAIIKLLFFAHCILLAQGSIGEVFREVNTAIVILAHKKNVVGF